MKCQLSHISIIFLLLNGIFFNASCQAISGKDSPSFHKKEKVFDKKPNFAPIIDNVTKPMGYVNDYDNLFSSDEIYQLDSLLYNCYYKDSIQIILITFDTSQMGPGEITTATKSFGKLWKVGGNSRKDIIVGISKFYRKIRIENSVAVQKILSDEETKQIIDNGFIPQFKNDQYFEGTRSGLQLLIRTLEENLKSFK
ncbi:MAG: TPM domain-containing protein [Ginsengibacter sp.]